MAAPVSTKAAEVHPIDFHGWIDKVRPELKPPVGNKLLYGDGQHKVMIVGGPNVREDYHLEEGEEIFFQLEGDMCLEVIEHGKRKPVVIQEGEIFLLPGKIPHSPQRKAGTVGLVLERERLPTEVDGLRWYTKDSDPNVLYQEFFHCFDLGVQLKPVIERYFESEPYKTGTPARRYSESECPIKVDSEITLHEPINLKKWIAEAAATSATNDIVLFGPGAKDPHLAPFEYQVTVVTGPVPRLTAFQPSNKGEVFFYQLEGSAIIKTRSPGSTEETDHSLKAGHVLLLPGGNGTEWCGEFGKGAALIVTNSVVA